VLGNLVQRFWLESQGMRQINLESVIPDLVIPGPGSESGAGPGSESGAGPIRDPLPASAGAPWIAGQARNDNAGGTA
jgi:hypothetical protein